MAKHPSVYSAEDPALIFGRLLGLFFQRKRKLLGREFSLPLKKQAVVGHKLVLRVYRVQDHRGRMLLDNFCVYVQRRVRFICVFCLSTLLHLN